MLELFGACGVTGEPAAAVGMMSSAVWLAALWPGKSPGGGVLGDSLVPCTELPRLDQVPSDAPGELRSQGRTGQLAGPRGVGVDLA